MRRDEFHGRLDGAVFVDERLRVPTYRKTTDAIMMNPWRTATRDRDLMPPVSVWISVVTANRKRKTPSV